MNYSHLPSPIEPVYSTNYPSQKIHLYEGELKCTYQVDGNTYEFLGTGIIQYAWFPYPQAKFQISQDIFSIPHDADNLNIVLPNSNVLIPGTIQNWGARHNRKSIYYISGYLEGTSAIDTGEALQSMIFHIVNFDNYIGEPTCKHTQSEYFVNKGRISLFEGDWEIIIDAVSSSEKTSDKLLQELKEDGGYAITHVGKIVKQDGRSFNSQEAVEIVNLLSAFLSFARGLSVPIVLLVGYNIAGDKVYEQWNAAFGQPWQSHTSWLPTQEISQITKIFPQFIRWFNDWGQSSQMIINMYLNANNNEFEETRIILYHTILEIMARVVLVEIKSIISESEYDKRGSISPADKISLLLKELRIPTDFPPVSDSYIANLVKFAIDNIPEKDRKNRNAAEAAIVFTKIRNDVTHAKKKYNCSSAALFDTVSLGLWYVEMAILSMLDYDGVYNNRLHRPKWQGEYETVPWSQTNAITDG